MIKHTKLFFSNNGTNFCTFIIEQREPDSCLEWDAFIKVHPFDFSILEGLRTFDGFLKAGDVTFWGSLWFCWVPFAFFKTNPIQRETFDHNLLCVILTWSTNLPFFHYVTCFAICIVRDKAISIKSIFSRCVFNSSCVIQNHGTEVKNHVGLRLLQHAICKFLTFHSFMS